MKKKKEYLTPDTVVVRVLSENPILAGTTDPAVGGDPTEPGYVYPTDTDAPDGEG